MKTESREKAERLKEILHASRYAVFFGGAGMSTESGIPDFRGTKGIYTVPKKKKPSGEPPEYLLSHTCLVREPEKFFDFYRSDMLYPDAKPNAGHLALAKLEEAGILKAVITQNIDGLHQAAGSRNVIELHGSVFRNYCARCGAEFPSDYIQKSSGIPRCDRCGGTVRPDVVLYEENLRSDAILAAAAEVDRADVLIVGGSSLVVYPAASFVSQFRGAHCILINYSPTAYDRYAEFVIRDSLSEILAFLV